MTMLGETAATAGLAAIGASLAASIPIDAGTADAIARWPLTVILGALCCYCVYMMYRQSRDFALAASSAANDHATALKEAATISARSAADIAGSSSKATTEAAIVMARAVSEMVAELKQRPCIRDPHND